MEGVQYRPTVEYQVCIRRWGTHEGAYEEVCGGTRVDGLSEQNATFPHVLAVELLTLIKHLKPFRASPGRINEVHDDGRSGKENGYNSGGERWTLISSEQERGL